MRYSHFLSGICPGLKNNSEFQEWIILSIQIPVHRHPGKIIIPLFT
jgi:hypothetical protein